MEKNFRKSPLIRQFFSVCVFIALFVTSGFAQHLTISTGGQTGTSGTNWSITGDTLNVGASGSATIDPSVITNHLSNVGDLTVILPWQSGTPRNMNINASISYTGGTNRTLTLNCANDMVFANATGITSSTASLNVVLRTALNVGDPDRGYIQMNGVTIQTKGGHFWAGGGPTAATWNGLTVGNSLARTWSDDIPGIAVVGSSITTKGGNLYLAGLSHDTFDDNGVNWGVNIERSTISSDAGSIEIIGEVKGEFTNGSGTYFNGQTGAVSIGTTSGAITINGYGYDDTSGNNWRHGILSLGTVAIRTVSGNISLRGEANFISAYFDKEGIIFGSGTSVCSQTGNITLRGTNTRESDGQYSNSIRFAASDITNGIRIGFDGTNAYSGNILIEGNSIYQRDNNAGAGSISVQTTGNLTIQPTGNAFTFMRAGNAGTLTFDDDWNFGTTLGSFTYGKSTNTANLTLSSPRTTAGAMSIYAGNIIAQQNLTTTNANADILLQATGYIETGANITTTAASNITLNANAGFYTGSTNLSVISNRMAITSAGGNITINADMEANGSGVLNLDYLTINPGAGNTIIRGETFVFNTGSDADKPWINGTGSFTLESNDAAFGQGLLLKWFKLDQDANGMSGLTIGKTTNTQNVTHDHPGGIVVAGPVTIYGLLVEINENLISTALGAKILLKALGYVWVNVAGKTVQSNNGDIIFWADADNSQASPTAGNNDEIVLLEGVIVNTQGGKLIMAGGLDDGANGGVASDGIPDNYAYRGGGSFRGGVNLGLERGTGPVVSLLSGGGDIIIKGRSAYQGQDGRPGVTSQSNLLINSGTGRINIQGISSVNHGIEFTYGQVPNIAITSSYAGVGPAITMAGGSTSNLGINLFNSASGNFLIQSASPTGGGIFMKGSTASNSREAVAINYYGNSNAITQLLSGSGDIVLTTDTVGTVTNALGTIKNSGITRYGVIAAATAVQGVTPTVINSNANVVFRGNDVYFDPTKTTTLATTGSFKIEPRSADNSFSAATTIRNLDISTVSAFTSGKVGNTAALTISSALTAAAPMTFHGAAMTIGGALTATNNTINLHATGAVTQTLPIVASNLGLHGTGTFTLNNTSNNVTMLAGGESSTRLGSLSFTDASGGLTIGTVGTKSGVHSSGTVLVETLAGDLSIGQNISTTNTSENAIHINAGKSAAIGTRTGGDIKLSGSPTPTLSMGTGGIAKLFSGFELNSTGLTTLVGGESNVRVNADETTTVFTPDLATNKAHAIYRTAMGTGDLTIVSSGGDAEGSTWVYDNGIFTTISSPVNIRDSIIQSKLALNDVAIEANKVTFSASIINPTANNFKVLAKTHIVNTIATTISSNGGDVLLASNVDDATDFESTNNGYIRLLFGVTINTNGGDITLGGGNNQGSDFALGSSTDNHTDGVRIDQVANFNSGGGNIAIKGKSYAKSEGGANRASGLGFYILSSADTISSGTGTILLDGYSQTTGSSYSSGIVFYVNNASFPFTIQSANTTANAITINGYAHGVSGGDVFGIESEETSLNITATGAGGGVTINAGNNTNDNFYDIVLRGPTNILANGGPISLNGKYNNGKAGGRLFLENDLYLGSKAGSVVPSSSSDITIQFDRYYPIYNTRQYIATVGAVDWKPASVSFSETINTTFFSWNQNGQTMRSFTFGKPNNTGNLTIDRAITAAGPINMYGGVITINAALTSSDTGNIFIKSISNDVAGISNNSIITKSGGTGVLTMQGNSTVKSGNSITTSGTGKLDVVLWSDFDNTNNDGGVGFDGTISTNGGHVWMGGSNSNGGSYTWNGLTVGNGPSIGTSNSNNFAMDFFGNITTNGGDVLTWAGNGVNGLNGIITNIDGSNVNTGSGDLIFIADQVIGTHSNTSIFHTGTGKVYLLPDAGSYGTSLDWTHNNTPSVLNIGGIYNYIVINNSTSITGLNLGYYDQMSDSQGPVIMTNTSPVTISSPNTIAGPIGIYGGAIALNANFATSDTLTGNMIIKGTSLTGTGNLTLAKNRNVNIDVAATSTYNGIISGNQASFTKAGSGLLTLQKDHTYTGATLITMGNLQVGSGGSLSQASSGTINSTSSVTIDSSAKLILAPNEDITFSRPVSGVGGLEIKGASGAYYNVFLTSTAATIATNATVLEILTRITGGLQAGAQIGSGSGEQTAGAYIKSYNALTNTATLQFQQFDGTYTKCVFAELSQSGTNVQIRGNTSIYNGAAYRTGNHLGVDMSTGSITIGALATSKTGSGYGISNVYMSGKVNFTGALTYLDTTILSNTVTSSTSPNTYSFTSKGTQEITDISSSFPGAVINNGLVIFKRATPLTIAGNMSGSEEILQVGAPITLLGNNTHSGIITIAKDSSLLIGNGGTSGSIAGNVVNYGRLTFNRSDSSNYRGVISGSGTLIKSGQSPLLLTGANTYTGPTVINAGNLIFENNIPATASSSFSGAGLLEIRPASASFTNAVSYPISGFNISTSIGGLTIGKPGNTANISLTAPVQTAGPVSFYGGDLAINHNIRTNSTGADVLLKATGKINLGATDTIFTNAGDVSLWADADGNSTGYAQLQANSAIVTDGGDINLGGGTDLTTGYAIGTAAETCPETTGTQYISGVHLRSGTALNSNGGNINIRGKNTGTANAAMSFGVGFRGSVIHSGTGKIAITGVASGSGSANVQAVSNWDQLTLRSASTASDAISIIGDALNVNNAGTAMGMNLNAIIEATGTGGGITLNGASGTATGTKISTSFYGDLLAASGPITIIGSNPTGIQDNVSFSGTTVIGKKAGTNVTSSSSNVTIEGNVMATPGAVTIDCIGSLTVRPNSSFTSAFTWPMTNVTVPGAITGLTLGKASNTANITVAANQSIAGPISIYGGKININGALTATNSNLNLHARDSVNQTAPITGSGLGLHGTGHFSLSHASNNVSTIAGGVDTTRLGSLHYVDMSGGLEIGSVNPTGIYAAGPVLIETTAGDIELKQPVSSNSNVDSLTGYKGAIVLNAGKSINISTDTGGDIVVTGSGSVSAPNGIVKLFAGNSDGSTGLNSLVGGASNIRTFVDETTTTFSPVLISKEKYAMYRDRSRCFADTASSTPTICISGILPLVTIATTGSTGIGTPSGLPAGVTAAWAFNTITIQGTPSEAGVFTYSIPLTGDCGTGNPMAIGTITVDSLNTVSVASSTPTLCINTALTDITHTTTGATGIGLPTGLPAGITATWASNVITLSGTPTAAGTFNYIIPLTGGCGNVNALGTITVTPNNTVSPGSTSTVCLSSALTNITHTTTGATGIGSILGLPLGVSATWASNTITISGTPTETGIFNYSILLTGGCGNVTATGTITVNSVNTVTAASSTPTLCINTALTDITHRTTGATGIGIPNGLPVGVTARWAADSILLSGTPSDFGTFNYTIPLTGGCGDVSATGSITVTPANTVSAGSTSTVCLSSALTNITHTTTGATGIGTATGLPAGVTAIWASNTITISGTPTATGIFTYNIPLTGGCGTVSAGGTITVNAVPTAAIAVTDQSGLTNNDGTICDGMDAILTATGGSTFTWGDGSTNSILKVSPTSTTSYSVTVVDNNGCSAMVNTTVSVNSLPVPIVTSTRPNCPTSTTGTALASAGSGWSYLWSSGATTAGITGLTQGLYVVTVTDVNGCMGTASASLVDSTTPITIVTRKTDVLCYGAQTGDISLAVTGGTSSYTYAWSANALGSTNDTLTNLPKGNYTVTVTEIGGNSCRAISTIEIVEPSFGMQLNLLVNENSGALANDGTICASESATIKVNVLLNSGASSYLWSVSGNTDDSLVVNTAGAYSVTVTDNIGCVASATSSAITVTPDNTVGAASSVETLCLNTALTNITHTTTGATGIGTSTGLPAGVTAVWASNTITISGTPTVIGTYNYNIPLTGGCGNVAATGTITVTEITSVSLASTSPTLCNNTPLTDIIHTTTGTTGIGTPDNLPAGVIATWSNNTLTISGTPTASGTFYYTIPIIGGCGSVNARVLLT
jgi:autotransporter-associated beta strand protein